MKALANNLIDALRAQPFVLALIIVNIAFLIAMTLVLRDISKATARKDALIERCLSNLK